MRKLEVLVPECWEDEQNLDSRKPVLVNGAVCVPVNMTKRVTQYIRAFRNGNEETIKVTTSNKGSEYSLSAGVISNNVKILSDPSTETYKHHIKVLKLEGLA